MTKKARRRIDGGPAANQRLVFEQVRLNCDPIRAGHVLEAIDPFEHENLKVGLFAFVVVRRFRAATAFVEHP